MATLVQRCRQVVSAEDDDFFKADTILYYLNKSQRKVVSYMVNQERQQDKSLRALDLLKSNSEITLSTGTAKGDYFEVDEAFPTGLNQILHLRYNQSTILRELASHKLYLLEWGNLSPTQYESYYYVVNDGTDKTFRLYLHENPDGTSDTLNLFYVSNPTDLTLTDETLADLPEQLENAVVYGAAIMMIGQESVKDPEGNVQAISQIYTEELQSSVY